MASLKRRFHLANRVTLHPLPDTTNSAYRFIYSAHTVRKINPINRRRPSFSRPHIPRSTNVIRFPNTNKRLTVHCLASTWQALHLTHVMDYAIRVLFYLSIKGNLFYLPIKAKEPITITPIATMTPNPTLNKSIKPFKMFGITVPVD